MFTVWNRSKSFCTEDVPCELYTSPRDRSDVFSRDKETRENWYRARQMLGRTTEAKSRSQVLGRLGPVQSVLQLEFPVTSRHGPLLCAFQIT
jgi:hypothetical protein